MTFLTIFGVTEISCSFKLILEGKTGKEISVFSIWKSLLVLRKARKRSWSVLFTVTYFFLIHTLSSSAGKKICFDRCFPQWIRPQSTIHLAHAEQRYIQNARQIQNSVKHLWWSTVQKLLTAIVVFENYNCFCNISFSLSLRFLI